MPIRNKIYSITHFETVPAASYLTTLAQDKETGELTVESTECAPLCALELSWLFLKTHDDVLGRQQISVRRENVYNATV
jgi:hypothetical protein